MFALSGNEKIMTLTFGWLGNIEVQDRERGNSFEFVTSGIGNFPKTNEDQRLGQCEDLNAQEPCMFRLNGERIRASVFSTLSYRLRLQTESSKVCFKVDLANFSAAFFLPKSCNTVFMYVCNLIFECR